MITQGSARSSLHRWATLRRPLRGLRTNAGLLSDADERSCRPRCRGLPHTPGSAGENSSGSAVPALVVGINTLGGVCHVLLVPWGRHIVAQA